MKKVASLIGAGALLMATAVPAFASWCTYSRCPSPDKSGDISLHNFAVVDTDAVSIAKSGNNYLGGLSVFGGSITTGKAEAWSIINNDLNSSIIGCRECKGDIDIFNKAFVDAHTFAKADSGHNSLSGLVVGGGAKITAGAVVAGSLVDNVVNFSMVGMELPVVNDGTD